MNPDQTTSDIQAAITAAISQIEMARAGREYQNYLDAPAPLTEKLRPPIDVESIIPEVNLVTAEDFAEVGYATAYRLAGLINDAKAQGKKVVIDMPTGSSPKSTWEALAQMVQEEKVDLSHVIWFGHEADWPRTIGTDYEGQRHDILKKLGITIKPITLKDAQAGNFTGNYISMHQLPLNYPTNPKDTLTTAKNSAAQYDQILIKLSKQDNLVWIALYGVGEDCHGWGELQQMHMWPGVWQKTRKTFIEPSSRYTPQEGMWPLLAREGFDPGDNFKDNPDMFLMGLGRQHMLRADYVIHIFNNQSKAHALANTKDALLGNRPGKGEAMLPEFKEYASELGVECQDLTTCYQVFKAILKRFGKQENAVYGYVWKLATEYFGSMTPVAKMILERQAQGKPTTLVTNKTVESLAI